MRDPAAALRWIGGELRRLGVPYQAVGGLAAVAWGSSRTIVDLDFYVPGTALGALRERLRANVIFGPDRLRGDLWDVTVLAFSQAGVTVELGSADDARYRDREREMWVLAGVQFDRSVPRTVWHETVPVMPRDELIRYKRALRREVDLLDLHYLTDADDPVDTRLAVYGSLAPGEPNAGQLAALEGTWHRGTVRGELHPRGWGMSYGFPALVWHPDKDPVPVSLFTSTALPGHWSRLDRFEGPGYERRLVPVTLDDGRVVLAYIYLGRSA